MSIKRILSVASAAIICTLASVSHAQTPGVDEISQQIVTADVGSVQKVNSEGSLGPVFVFEEYHTSRLGQHQIAIMLLRLHDNHGLRLVGLEGAIQSPRPLDVKWFHDMGDPRAARIRQDVALRMLGEGEISAVEFMAMVFGDVRVFGLEIAQEYENKLDVEGNPEVQYLLKIAEKKLTQADIIKINELATDEKQEEAIEYMFNADPWVSKQFKAMKADSTSATMLQDSVKRLREIRDKANELNIAVDPKTKSGLEQSIRFFETATKRSETMSKRMVKLVAESNSQPTAMIIGAAHTKEVEDYFDAADVSYVTVRPLAHNPTNGNLTIEEFERKSSGQWARISPGTLGSVLNGKRKPSPIVETATGKSYASALFAAQLMAENVRRGNDVTGEFLKPYLLKLPECEVDFDSVRVEGHDVAFRMRLTDTSGKNREVWVKTGTVDRQEPVQSLEERLKQQIADLDGGGGGNKPPRDPPKDAEPTGGKEGPGDGKRAEVVVARLSPRAVAVFGDSFESVNRVGKVSG